MGDLPDWSPGITIAPVKLGSIAWTISLRQKTVSIPPSAGGFLYVYNGKGPASLTSLPSGTVVASGTLTQVVGLELIPSGDTQIQLSGGPVVLGPGGSLAVYALPSPVLAIGDPNLPLSVVGAKPSAVPGAVLPYQELFPGRRLNGQLAFQDDFSGGSLAWGSIISGTGTLTRDTTTGRVMTAGANMKLLTSAGAADSVFANRNVGDIGGHRMGMEFWFVGDYGSGGQAYMACEMDWYDGVTQHTAQVRFQPDDKFYAINQLNNYVALGNPQPLLQETVTGGMFHHFLLIADLDAGQYVKCQCDGRDYSTAISSIQTPSTANGTNPFLRYEVQLINNAAAIKTLYVCQVSATTDEP